MSSLSHLVWESPVSDPSHDRPVALYEGGGAVSPVKYKSADVLLKGVEGVERWERVINERARVGHGLNGCG